MKRVAITAGMLALVLAGCGGDGGGDAAAPGEQPAAASTATATPAAPAAKAGTVEIKTFQFQPKPITVKAGDTVTFVNRDATTHTVVAGTRKKPDEDAFKGSLDEGGTFEQTFMEPGEYDYFCDLHAGPGMVGKVVVQ